jgi:hypothetical protein
VNAGGLTETRMIEIMSTYAWAEIRQTLKERRRELEQAQGQAKDTGPGADPCLAYPIGGERER